MVTATAVAQTRNITVRGKVVDKDSGEPVVQATVQLMTMPDSAYVNGAATLEQGQFELPKVGPGKYLMKISFIGYKNMFEQLTLTNNRPNVDVGMKKMERFAFSERAKKSYAVIQTGEARQYGNLILVKGVVLGNA